MDKLMAKLIMTICVKCQYIWIKAQRIDVCPYCLEPTQVNNVRPDERGSK